MKKLFSFLMLTCCLASVFGQGVVITESVGWLESAFVKWTPVDGAESYNIYYSGEGIADRKIDDQLIRKYPNYFRADVLGLKAGQYTLKVAAVVGGSEVATASTPVLTVKAHDRSGFAFANGRVPGAYKADGTLKDNAVVLYITQNTKNTVSIDITGATTNPCVGLQRVLDGIKRGKDLRPFVFRFVGQITDLTYMWNGDIVVENAKNAASYITLEGVGDDAVLDGFGLRIKSAMNVEVRNLGTMNCDSGEGDNIGLQQDNSYVWVHHCDFFYGHAGGDADQAKGDGALDCKKSTYVTFSYNHFFDSGKSNLLGLSEGTTAGLYITYHHNWYDHSDSRHPRVRFYSAHVYNNYYDGVAKYGVGSTQGSSVFVEKNYFRNCPRPMMISMQGTDTKMGTDETNSPTFSKEPGGIIKAFDNVMEGNVTFAPYSESNTVQFDAYVVAASKEVVPSTVLSKLGGNAYNNFDSNASIMYAYTPHAPEEVVAEVTQYAGRVMGGDFKWQFNNAVDDASYALNPALKAALTSYKTALLGVQNDGDGSGDPGGSGDTEEDPEEPGEPGVTGDLVHNFTVDGFTSTAFKIVGNKQSSPTTFNYGDLVLSQCLKMESATSITFSTSRKGKLTLVFPPSFIKKVKVDGIAYTASAGVVVVDIEAGEHVITKGDTTDLYYIGIALEASSEIDAPSSSTVVIYPNPVVDQLYLSNQENILSVELFNLAGISLLRTQRNTERIDMSGLAKGEYLVKILTSDGAISRVVTKR